MGVSSPMDQVASLLSSAMGANDHLHVFAGVAEAALQARDFVLRQKRRWTPAAGSSGMSSIKLA